MEEFFLMGSLNLFICKFGIIIKEKPTFYARPSERI